MASKVPSVNLKGMKQRAGMSLVDEYFYEELLRMGGRTEATEWLKNAKCSSSSSSASSASSSPRSSTRASQMKVTGGLSNSMKKSSSSTYLVQLGLLEEDATSYRRKSFTPIQPCLEHKDAEFEKARENLGSNAGLLYTDAAHLLRESHE
eukprot:754065-Hanusia_phi.AAC.3